jgi:hypothetical protein
MSNPFVFAVMNAFRGKLPKSETEQAKDDARDEEHSSPSDTPTRPPQRRED